jgi:hypothetical protein
MGNTGAYEVFYVILWYGCFLMAKIFELLKNY